MADIPIVRNDKGDVLGWDGKEWRAPDSVAQHPSGRKAYLFGQQWQVDPEQSETLNTLATTGAGVIKGASEAMNPALLGSNLATLGQGVLRSIPGMAPIANMTRGAAGDISKGLREAAPRTQGADIALRMPGVSNLADAMKGAGVDMAAAPRTPEAVGAEMTPLRRALANVGEGVGGALPFAGMGVAQTLGYGALSGAGAAAGEEVGGSTGKLVGALAAPIIGARVGASRAAKAYNRPPSESDLLRQSKDAYRRSEEAGAIFTGEGLRGLQRDVKSLLAEERFRRSLHPATNAAYRELASDARRGHITFEGMEGLRKTIGRYMGAAANKDDRRLLYALRDKVDDFVQSPPSGSVLMGDSGKAADAILEARSAYSKASKSADIENLLKKAELRAGPNYAAAGLEHAIRKEFQKLALNDKAIRRYTPGEQKAIGDVAFGGGMDNFLRWAGKFSPKGALTGMAHGANIAMNPIVGLPLAGATMLARSLATQSTMKNARLVQEMMRRGGPPESAPLLNYYRRQFPPAALVGAGATARE